MLNFKLFPGDKYDGRCAEIYITEKQFLIYHCSICEEIYTKFNELLSHITKVHYENTKEYKVEDRSVETIISQENGKENYLATKEQVLKAKISNKSLVGNLTTESKRAEGRCEQTFNEIAELKVALETGDIPPLLKSNKSLPQRKKIRIVTGSLKCPAIGRIKTNNLTRYQINSNEQRKYVCTVCGFAFKEKYNLRGHLLRHSNQKNVSCSICPKKFFAKVELRLHEYRHRVERPHLCAHCGMGFISSGSLTQHMKKQHSQQRSFKCEQCYKAFSNFYQLKDHQPVHTKECNNYQCTECLLTFKCEKSISKNLKLYENNHKYRCENCDLELNSATALNSNQKQEYGFIDESEQKLVVEKHVRKDINGDEKIKIYKG